MIPGNAELVRQIATAARGHLATMTLAPEIAGVCGPDGAIEALGAAGAIPFVGHTNASAEQVDTAIDKIRTALARPGARSARPTTTHLFNGTRALHHRDPGPIAACLGAAGRGDGRRAHRRPGAPVRWHGPCDLRPARWGRDRPGHRCTGRGRDAGRHLRPGTDAGPQAERRRAPGRPGRHRRRHRTPD